MYPLASGPDSDSLKEFFARYRGRGMHPDPAEVRRWSGTTSGGKSSRNTRVSGPMKPFDETVCKRAGGSCCPMFNTLGSQIDFVEMSIGSTTVFAAAVSQSGWSRPGFHANHRMAKPSHVSRPPSLLGAC
jgi:hypothetical protein